MILSHFEVRALAFPCFPTLVSFNIFIIMIRTTDGKQSVRKLLLLQFVAIFKCDFGIILTLIKSDIHSILSFENFCICHLRYKS